MPRDIVVFNRRSGADPTRARLVNRLLARRLRADGRQVLLIRVGRRHRPWEHRLRRALRLSTARVFVLGGDGTVLSAADALLSDQGPTKAALGIIPLGTANLLARDLGIPLDPHRAVDALLHGGQRWIDVGSVNGHPFLCASMLGLPTHLAQVREAGRRHGLLRIGPRLIRRGLWLLRRYPYTRVRMELAHGVVELRTRTMVIANNPLRAEAGLYPRRDRLDSGLLGIYGVREGPLHELPRLAATLLAGTWRDEPQVFVHQSARVRLQSDRRRRIRVLNDGEGLRLTTPLAYSIRPRALAVLVPADSAERPDVAIAEAGSNG